MSEKDETIVTGSCVKANTSVQMGGIVTTHVQFDDAQAELLRVAEA